MALRTGVGITRQTQESAAPCTATSGSYLSINLLKAYIPSYRQNTQPTLQTKATLIYERTADKNETIRIRKNAVGMSRREKTGEEEAAIKNRKRRYT